MFVLRLIPSWLNSGKSLNNPLHQSLRRGTEQAGLLDKAHVATD